MFKQVLSLCLLLCSPSSLPAGTMTTSLRAVGRFDQHYNPLPFAGLPDGPIHFTDGPGIYQIAVLFEAANEANNKGWANTLFNIRLSGGVTNGGGWAAFDESLNNGPIGVPVFPVYATNGDLGLDTTDLQSILVSISGPGLRASDRRNKLGTPAVLDTVGYPTLFGSVFVNWDGVTSGSVALTDQTYSFTILDNTFAPVQVGAGDTLLFSGVPEPPAISSL